MALFAIVLLPQNERAEPHGLGGHLASAARRKYGARQHPNHPKPPIPGKGREGEEEGGEAARRVVMKG